MRDAYDAVATALWQSLPILRREAERLEALVAASDEPSDSAPSGVVVEHELAKLSQLLAERNMACMEVHEKLHAVLVQARPQAAKQLAESIERLDFDTALKMCSQLTEIAVAS